MPAVASKIACNFYPRPPGGGRPVQADTGRAQSLFLSTPSGWRATDCDTCLYSNPCDFYPRPPGGGRRRHISSNEKPFGFLSTPSGWRATTYLYAVDLLAVFLSTPSGWRATVKAGGTGLRSRNFYPRPPGGGRPRKSIRLHGPIHRFLSTPSGWRATHDHAGREEHRAGFLSTPSGWRATSVTINQQDQDAIFLSTPSGWRATLHPFCQKSAQS